MATANLARHGVIEIAQPTQVTVATGPDTARTAVFVLEAAVDDDGPDDTIWMGPFTMQNPLVKPVVGQRLLVGPSQVGIADLSGFALARVIRTDRSGGDGTVSFGPGAEVPEVPPDPEPEPPEPPDGEPPEYDFTSDWSTATGADHDALYDTNQAHPWSDAHNGSSHQLLTVVSAEGLGFPEGMENVLSVKYNGEDSAEMRALNVWPEPQVDEEINVRLYYRLDVPGVGFSSPNASHHPIEPIYGTCPYVWEFKVGPGNGSNQDQDLGIIPDDEWCIDLCTPVSFWRSPRLKKRVPYQLRFALKRVSATAMQITALELWSAEGAFLFGPDAFVCPNTGRTFASEMGQSWPFQLADCLRSLTVGQNGATSWNLTPEQGGTYVGGVAVSRQAMPGNYVVGERAA